jgi:Molecular chaperone GrpE (heat shock protein)
MRRSKFRVNDAQARGDTMRDDGAEMIDDAGPAQPFGPASADTATPETDIVEDISELQRDLALERDKLLRLAAEFDNYRKRMMRERLEAETRGKADLVKDILELWTTSPDSPTLTRRSRTRPRSSQASRWWNASLRRLCLPPASK